jgi:hypothetical protein
LLPLAEAQTEFQLLAGRPVFIQFIPAFVDTKTGPTARSPAAIKIFPSAEEAMENQFVFGALVCVHVWAQAKFAMPQTTATSRRIVMGFIRQLVTNRTPAGKFVKRQLTQLARPPKNYFICAKI